MPNQSAPITKEKIIGKKLTLFIYQPTSGKISERHLRRLLFGRLEKRTIRRRSWKGYSYAGVVVDEKDSTNYRYMGILSGIFCWRPLKKASLFFVERKEAKKVATIFDEFGVNYIQGNIVVTQIQNI
jgi:hypothetical protein